MQLSVSEIEFQITKQVNHRLEWKPRGGAINLPTEGLQPPTRGLKWLKSALFVRHFAKFAPTKTQNFLRRPSSPPLAPPLNITWNSHYYTCPCS